MPNPMNEKQEIQRQLFDWPLPSIVRCPGGNPGMVLTRNVGPVLENERDEQKQNKGDQYPPAETPWCDHADQQPDSNGVNLEIGGDRHANGRAVPALGVN